ncbi:MAG: type IX secretion system membrane protein PorP/SprF [Bacteroidota bacterium]
MKKLIILAALAASATFATAQQQQNFSLYQFFKQGFNPGYVGSAGPLAATLDYRNQWVNTDGSPTSFNAGVHGLLSGTRSKQSRHAMGLLFSNDQIGVSKANSIALQYAYRLPVSNKMTLSFGVQAGYLQTMTNFSQLQVADAPDPVASENMKANSANVGAGLYLYSTRFFAGISSPGLLRNNKDFSGNDNPQANSQHYYLMSGYVFPVSNEVKLRASGLLKTTILEKGKTPAIADFNLAAILYDRLLVGASYRTDNTVLAIAQIQLTRALNVGYGLDFNTGNIGRPSGVSHEIVLGFNLVSSKAAFTTPRFITYF